MAEINIIDASIDHHTIHRGNATPADHSHDETNEIPHASHAVDTHVRHAGKDSATKETSKNMRKKMALTSGGLAVAMILILNLTATVRAFASTPITIERLETIEQIKPIDCARSQVIARAIQAEPIMDIDRLCGANVDLNRVNRISNLNQTKLIDGVDTSNIDSANTIEVICTIDQANSIDTKACSSIDCTNKIDRTNVIDPANTLDIIRANGAPAIGTIDSSKTRPANYTNRFGCSGLGAIGLEA